MQQIGRLRFKRANESWLITENPWNAGKTDVGSVGGLGAILIVNFDKRVAKKLCIIILLHFELISFRFHFGKTWQVIILMILGFLDVSITPKANSCWLRINQMTQKNSRKKSESPAKNMFRNLKVLEIEYFQDFEKDRRQTNQKFRFMNYWRSWIWDQYLPMKPARGPKQCFSPNSSWL